MAVFLTVLKVIGIILLCIIGFLLLIILLALFVPIRYKLKGNKGIENSDIKASVCVSWLLHLISFKAEFVDSKLAYSLNALSPLNVISRGYSLTLKNNDIVKSINDVNADDYISIKVKDGMINATVLGVISND